MNYPDEFYESKKKEAKAFTHVISAFDKASCDAVAAADKLGTAVETLTSTFAALCDYSNYACSTLDATADASDTSSDEAKGLMERTSSGIRTILESNELRVLKSQFSEHVKSYVELLERSRKAVEDNARNYQDIKKKYTKYDNSGFTPPEKRQQWRVYLQKSEGQFQTELRHFCTHRNQGARAVLENVVVAVNHALRRCLGTMEDVTSRARLGHAAAVAVPEPVVTVVEGPQVGYELRSDKKHSGNDAVADWIAHKPLPYAHPSSSLSSPPPHVVGTVLPPPLFAASSSAPAHSSPLGGVVDGVPSQHVDVSDVMPPLYGDIPSSTKKQPPRE